MEQATQSPLSRDALESISKIFKYESLHNIHKKKKQTMICKIMQYRLRSKVLLQNWKHNISLRYAHHDRENNVENFNY